MKKVLLASLTLCTLCSTTTIAQASVETEMLNSPFYVAFRSGISNLETKNFDNFNTVMVAPAVGMHLNEFFRTELEYNYNTHYDEGLTIDYYYDPFFDEGRKETAEIRMDTISVQVYADIPSKTNFTPFLNAGIGITRTETEYNDEGPNDIYKVVDGETTISWNVGAGISAKINDSLTLDAMYRYTDFGRVSDLLDTDMTANKFMIGARYRF